MNIDNKNPSFCGSIIWSKALKETRAYANSIGQTDVYSRIRERIKTLPERQISIKHIYSKKYELTKTQFKFFKDNLAYLYVYCDSKTKKPVEVTFNLLKDLLNSNSEIYKKIYG